MPKTLRVPKGAKLGPGTIYTGCENRYTTGDDLKFNKTGEILNANTGQFVAIPSPSVPAGQKLVGYGCTVGGDETHIRVFYVMTLSVPSEGLTPERRSTSIAAFDPFASAPPQLAPWPEGVTVQEVSPSNYGFFARTSAGLLGFNGTTLQSTSTCTDNNRAGNCWHNFAGFGRFREDGQAGEEFYSAADGGKVGENVGSTMSGGVPMSPDGMVVVVGTGYPYRYGYFDFHDNKMKEVASEFNMVLWDDLLMQWGTDYIKILNLTTNSVVFHRDGDDVKNLHLKNVHFAGTYLYIDNDSDKPVIDITNSQKVSSGWKLMPIQRVARDWILVDSHNPNRNQSCFSKNTINCPAGDNSELVYAPNGKYAGPWF